MKDLQFFNPNGSLAFYEKSALSVPDFDKVPSTEFKLYRSVSRSFTPMSDICDFYDDTKNKIEQLQDFWKGNKSRMPQLPSIALSFGFLQSSSAAVERSFSCFSNIVTPDRQCLDTETIKQLLFLYMNSGKLN